MRSISSTDLDSTDPVSTPSRDQQATASPRRKRGILVFSGVAIIAIASSGAYAFTAHSTAAAVKDVQAQLVAADSDFTAARESAQASIALAGEYVLESENVTTLKSIYADSDATVTALAEAPNNAKASNEKVESLKKVLDQAKASTSKLNAALAPIAGELDDLTIKKLTDAVGALGEKSNQVRDSRTQWEAEQAAQAAAASSNAGGSSYSNGGGSHSRSTGSTAGRSYSNNGGGSAAQSSGSTGGSQGRATGESYWVHTEEVDPSLGWTCSGTLGSDPSRCWGHDGKEMHRGANGVWH